MVNKRKLAGLLLFIGVLQFLFSLMLAEFLYPGYSVSQNYISDLGATCRTICQVYQPSSTIFNSSLVLTGIFVVAAGYFYWLSGGARSRLLTALLYVAGVSAAGVGLFPETTGILHSIFSIIVFFSMAFAAIASFRVIKQPLSTLSLLLGLMTLVFIFLYVGKVYLGLGAGGAERLIVYPVLFWALSFSGYLMSSE
ncbi:MAG: DUF998 domain-containing protein [Conexivisphaerales archaeon]